MNFYQKISNNIFLSLPARLMMLHRKRQRNLLIHTASTLCLVLFHATPLADIIETKPLKGTVSSIYTPYGGMSYEDLIDYFKTAYTSSGFKIGIEDTLILRDGEESLGRNSVLLFEYKNPDIPGVKGKIELYFDERFVKQGKCSPCLVSWIGKAIGKDTTEFIATRPDIEDIKKNENLLHTDMKKSLDVAKRKITDKFFDYPQDK